MLNWLIFAVIGKILIYLWMKFPVGFFTHRFIELHECDLCSGVWIYCILAVFFGVDIIQDTFGHTIFILGSLVTGAITSFVVHIFSIGWKTKFEVIVI
jgi:hypothetical protein